MTCSETEDLNQDKAEAHTVACTSETFTDASEKLHNILVNEGQMNELTSDH